MPSETKKSRTMKFNKQVLAAIAAATLSMTASQGVFAREFADIYTECGLGAMIAPNNAAVAAVTNVTWDLGTTAVTSNVSSADTCRGAKAKTAALILHTYPQLEQDLARGQGEHLSTLMVAAGCSAVSRDTVAASLRNQLAARAVQTGYSEASRAELAKAMFADLSAQSNSCSI
jgi:hypothetical protein